MGFGNGVEGVHRLLQGFNIELDVAPGAVAAGGSLGLRLGLVLLGDRLAAAELAARETALTCSAAGALASMAVLGANAATSRSGPPRRY